MISRSQVNLRLEGSIEALISFRESVKDLNSNEFRSPPSARHLKEKQSIKHQNIFRQFTFFKRCLIMEKYQRWKSGSFVARCTLICSSRAVRREIRCVRLPFVTLCWPSLVELLSWTICWASSSQRRRSSVGWSDGAMP